LFKLIYKSVWCGNRTGSGMSASGAPCSFGWTKQTAAFHPEPTSSTMFEKGWSTPAGFRCPRTLPLFFWHWGRVPQSEWSAEPGMFAMGQTRLFRWAEEPVRFEPRNGLGPATRRDALRPVQLPARTASRSLRRQAAHRMSRISSRMRLNLGCGATHMVRYVFRKGSQLS